MQRRPGAADFGQDISDLGDPGEYTRATIVVGDVLLDRGDQLAHMAKYPAPQASGRQITKPPLNLVERVFGDLTAKQIRRGVFRSVPELIAAIAASITQRNAHPQPFVWTKTAQAILAKVHRARIALDKTRTA